MIDYYLILPGMDETDMIFDEMTLGTNNKMGTFFASGGFNILQQIVNDNNEKLLAQIKIKDNKNKEWTIMSFLDLISQIEIRLPNE